MVLPKKMMPVLKRRKKVPRKMIPKARARTKKRRLRLKDLPRKMMVVPRVNSLLLLSPSLPRSPNPRQMRKRQL